MTCKENVKKKEINTHIFRRVFLADCMSINYVLAASVLFVLMIQL